ncbi:GntR family transcriptional regulator [Micromonospora rifamycinica]|uniref:GntR family transcriptional regulator n=1 Tax=Micromonospora rifamycinica TaxID=291594 RepID=UPI0039A5FC98
MESCCGPGDNNSPQSDHRGRPATVLTTWVIRFPLHPVVLISSALLRRHPDRGAPGRPGRAAPDRLPVHRRPASGTELCAEFEVSRQVVRSAIDWLKARGLVGGAPGAGVFVREPDPR